MDDHSEMRAEFWRWIQSSEGHQALAAIDNPSGPDTSDARGMIDSRLSALNDELRWYYYGATDIESPCLEISADGINRLVPDVEQLVAAAPSMDDLSVVAFRRPCQPGEAAMQFGDYRADLSTTLAIANRRGDGLYDVVVYLPFPSDLPRWMLGSAGSFLLEEGLGERFFLKEKGNVEYDYLKNAVHEAVPISRLAERLFSLKDLLDKITPDSIHEETDLGQPQGKEIW